MSTPSTLIADRYRLVKMLGAGGMGVVWQAWDERLHRRVALKMLRTQPELTDSERQLATERAMREARITAALHHPRAVTVFDVVEHDGRPCIVMQLVTSTPLSVLLKEHGTLSPPETTRIGAQIASALAAAHELRIVHRDVKPGNILIDADGSALISDFGISHVLGDATITATGVIHGTPAYLAPEVARGMRTSYASDVFSLGSTLYAMLEGVPPFGVDDNAIALLHKVARGDYPPPAHAGPLAKLLGRMLSPNPRRRPSMASVARSLSAWQGTAGIPVAGMPVSGLPVGIEPRIRHGAAEPVGPREPTAATVRLDDVQPDRAHHDPPAAMPVAVPPPSAPPSLSPTAETLRVDQPGSSVSSTAEPGTPGRRSSVLVAITIVAAVVLMGSVILFNALRPQIEAPGADPTAARTPSATAVAETPDADADEPAPSASVPPAEEADPEPPPPTPEERVAATIVDYYSLLPGNRDGAWPTMTADYQENHAGGRDGYEAFWSAIADVTVADVRATAPDQAQATLTYYFRDGRVVQEVTSYRLVDEGGVLKIAATEVLSSAQL